MYGLSVIISWASICSLRRPASMMAGSLVRGSSLLDALESLLDLEASIVAVKELSHQVWLSGLQLFQGGPFQKKAGGQIALQLAQDFQSQREIFFERSGNLLYAAFALLDCSAAILGQSFQQSGLHVFKLEWQQAVTIMTGDVEKDIYIEVVAMR